MRLRNKITGETENVTILNSDRVIHGIVEKSDGIQCMFNYTVQQFTDEWEDAPEEPKGYWFIENDGEVNSISLSDDSAEGITGSKAIGNYFSTKEEAELAVRKLKAWHRLKEKGFSFEGIKQDYTRFNQQEPMRTGRKYLQFNKSEDEDWMKENWEDLELLFGGEE